MDDYKRKYFEWLKAKEEEEKLLRELKCHEDIIKLLREYDKQIFNQERKYYYWNYEIFDYALDNMIYDQTNVIDTYDKLVDNMEDPDILQALKKLDPIEQRIITLKLQGYCFNEMANILHLNINTLYSRYKKIKKLIRESKINTF